MKFIVPDIIVPATGEKTLRQYKCARISSDSNNLNSDVIIAVTNRRIIQHAESGNSNKSDMVHNEIYLENIGGISLFRGKIFNKKGFKAKFILLFIIFAALSGAALWQSQPLFDYAVRSLPSLQNNVVFNIIIAAIPMLVFSLIMSVIGYKSRRYSINMVIMSKGMTASNIDLKGKYNDEENPGCIITPYIKESHKMFSELSAIILDIQRFGADEVLNYVDAEENL